MMKHFPHFYASHSQNVIHIIYQLPAKYNPRDIFKIGHPSNEIRQQIENWSSPKINPLKICQKLEKQTDFFWRFCQQNLIKLLVEQRNGDYAWAVKSAFKPKFLCAFFPNITVVMRWVIWHRLYNFKNVKNTRGRVLFLVKLHA